MANEIHVGDIGTLIHVSVFNQDDEAVDLSTSSEVSLLLTKPDGTILELPTDFYTDGTDGIITYTSVDGDFSVAGMYHIQPVVVFVSGTYHADIQTFRVHKNLR